MASTYSNLKIQLMATGENSTTWGAVTNLNLGTAIEEAIVGSADVTFASANVTLTLSNTNASQVARNLRLRCTGTTGGATRNLVVPSIEKPYLVKNDCADSVVVKTSAGTGITVPAGKTLWVYSDGTNVVDAVTHLSSLTLGTPLPVLSGGTGSNTASGARTNLGLGTMSTQNSNAVTITGGSITGITDLAVADGGTGASDAAGARTNLGLGALATLNTVNNANWSGTDLAIANGGTGASDAATARANLGAGTGNGTVTSVSASTGISGLSFSGSPVTSSGTLTLSGTLGVAGGGTGSTTASGARTNLGLGTLATLNTINNGNWSGTDLAVANGGTGASDTGTAQTNLNVPSRTGTGASGTWGISITGNAATATSATTATNATNLSAANFSIVQSGTNLLFRYNGVTIAILDSSGNFTAKQNVTAYGSI